MDTVHTRLSGPVIGCGDAWELAEFYASLLAWNVVDRSEQDPGGWDSMNSTFDMVDNQNNPLPSQDIYIGPEDPVNYTGRAAQQVPEFIEEYLQPLLGRARPLAAEAEATEVVV